MVNINGSLISNKDVKLSLENRAFAYGDGIFDTLKFENDRIFFLEDHYFRLMSSMRMLRMKIPMDFTLDYYENQINETLKSNRFNSKSRIRVSIFRKEGGLYTPLTNEIGFVIEVKPLQETVMEVAEIELYKDFSIASGLLSTIKTNNRLINVLGSIFAKENNFQNCMLINEKKEVVEALNANVFLIKNEEILTPPLTSGCINGIIRKKLLEALLRQKKYGVKEAVISPFDLLKADEVFLTNSIHEIQSVKRYRKKSYSGTLTAEIKEFFDSEIRK